MAKTAIHIISCDRCNKELGREEVGAEPTAPAYYRQVTTVVNGAPQTTERKLDHLCPRCTREVKKLDERIFTDSRVRDSDAENDSEPNTTNDDTNPKETAHA